METTRGTHVRTVAVVAVALLLAALAAPVEARPSRTVTQGDFAVFAGGLGLGYNAIVGTATMERHRGETEVEVEIESGLFGGLVYDSHVHALPCDQNNAGGHYQFDEDVPDAPKVNGKSEIWPGPFTARLDGSADGTTTVSAIAGPEAVSVVIHAPTGEKIACADLS